MQRKTSTSLFPQLFRKLQWYASEPPKKAPTATTKESIQSQPEQRRVRGQRWLGQPPHPHEERYLRTKIKPRNRSTAQSKIPNIYSLLDRQAERHGKFEQWAAKTFKAQTLASAAKAMQGAPEHFRTEPKTRRPPIRKLRAEAEEKDSG